MYHSRNSIHPVVEYYFSNTTGIQSSRVWKVFLLPIFNSVDDLSLTSRKSLRSSQLRTKLLFPLLLSAGANVRNNFAFHCQAFFLQHFWNIDRCVHLLIGQLLTVRFVDPETSTLTYHRWDIALSRCYLSGSFDSRTGTLANDGLSELQTLNIR